MGTLVWVRSIDMPFRVADSPERVLEQVRELAEEADPATLPFVELALDRGRGLPHNTVRINPWAIEALQELGQS